MTLFSGSLTKVYHEYDSGKTAENTEGEKNSV